MTLCDIGNTYLHFKTPTLICKQKADNLDKKFIQSLGNIYYISVSKANESKLLSLCSKTLNISEHIQIPTQYQGLGVDRRAACLSIKDGVIIDAGSAITIDVMEDGKHLGGYILPGLFSYMDAYAKISKVLHKPLLFNPPKDLPKNTQEAISYGIFESIIELIKKVSGQKRIIFTGGDGKHFCQFFEQSIYDEALIFRGMEMAIRQIIKSKQIILGDKL